MQARGARVFRDGHELHYDPCGGDMGNHPGHDEAVIAVPNLDAMRRFYGQISCEPQ